MGRKGLIVLGLIILWVLWPSIRIPKDNFFRKRFGALTTYLILILGILAVIQLIEYLAERAI